MVPFVNIFQLHFSYFLFLQGGKGPDKHPDKVPIFFSVKVLQKSFHLKGHTL